MFYLTPEQEAAGEQAVADIYALALSRWVPHARTLALPQLRVTAGIYNGDPALFAAASTLPPDPDAVATDDTWQAQTETILAGLFAVWAVTYMLAGDEGDGLDIPLPSLPERPATADAALYRAVARATGVTAKVAHQATAAVRADEVLRPQIDALVETRREAIDAVPAQLAAKATQAVALAEADTEHALDPGERRTIVEQVLQPASPEVLDLSRYAGYQAAGIQNNAIIAAALQSVETDLQKTWIATLDGKTRPTHWAADGQRVPLDGTFTIGQEHLYVPGDLNGSTAETRNCRCRVGVLAEDEELPDEIDRHTERLNGRDSVARNRHGRTQQEEIDKRAAEGNIRARDDKDGIGQVSASGGWTAPSEQGYDMTDMTTVRVPATQLSQVGQALATQDDDAAETYRTFTNAVIAFVGEPTSDGRMLSKKIDLTMRTFPHPLMWCKQTGYGHEDAYTVGVIESAEKKGGKVVASGYMLNTPEADEAANELAHGVSSPSVDLADTTWIMTDRDENEIDYSTYIESLEAGDPIELFTTVTEGELIGTTLVATAAFGDTKLTLNTERETRKVAVVASAVEGFKPRVYDHRLFSDPGLTGPTLPTLGEDGRYYGHLACFGECHRGIQNDCVFAPRSRAGYSHFHTSPAVRLDNGERLPVGRMTVGTGHADHNLAAQPAADHYDNTGTCFALVRVGEDAHGIWFSGVIAPWATTEQVEMGMAAPLSGDWRDFGQGLELVAALAVNTPGFMARGSSDDQGRPLALVASLGPTATADPAAVAGGTDHLTRADIASIVRGVADELAVRTAREAVMARARSTLGTPPVPPTNEERAKVLLARLGTA